MSFGVAAGTFCGIVGRDGLGTSTLLNCLGWTYRADRGTIHVRGRRSTFIELGLGFNPAARDNLIAPDEDGAVERGFSPRRPDVALVWRDQIALIVSDRKGKPPRSPRSPF